MKKISPVTKSITKGKFRARQRMPYLTHLWSMMRVVETDKVETMAVDQVGRLYANPEFVASIPDTQVAYCLMHETLHIVMSHAHRLAVAVPNAGEHERYAWNVAADLVIQQMLARHNADWEPDGIVSMLAVIPGDPMSMRFCDVPGIRPGMTVEQYYSLIYPLLPQQPGGQQGQGQQGVGQQGNPLDPGQAGSSSDGEPRPYEQQASSLGSTMMRRALKQAEKAANEHMQANGRDPGSVAGQLAQALRVRMERQPDPFDELRRVVARSTQSPLGTEDFTYQVINRRQQADQIRRRGYRRMAPECSIIVDTSGSMTGAEQKALTTIAQGLRRVQSPRVVCFDTQVQSAKRISSTKDFSFVGYGGTNMTKAITDEDRVQRPDCIVLVTDGETDWPSQPTRARLVIALVRKCYYSTPPEWAKVIDLTKEPESYVV